MMKMMIMNEDDDHDGHDHGEEEHCEDFSLNDDYTLTIMQMR